MSGCLEVEHFRQNTNCFGFPFEMGDDLNSSCLLTKAYLILLIFYIDIPLMTDTMKTYLKLKTLK